jgi:putative Holliday junction resolvase
LGRLIGIDFGGKRTGLSETDDLKIVAGAWRAIPTSELMVTLTEYIQKYTVDGIVVGKADRLSGEESSIETEIKVFLKEFTESHPEIAVYRQDESGTSQQAVRQLYAMGASKKARAKKENVDIMSAVLILQQFLENNTSL